MNTALSELILWLFESEVNGIDPIREKIYMKALLLLHKEKKQIMDAFMEANKPFADQQLAEEYFEQTYFKD